MALYRTPYEEWAEEREAVEARAVRRANRPPLTVAEIVSLGLIAALVLFGPVVAWAVAR